MVKETGKSHDLSSLSQTTIESINDEGYAGVALNLIEGLLGNKPVVQILNVPNGGAITGMDEYDVVEIPTLGDAKIIYIQWQLEMFLPIVLD